jgi:hypothetical protein
LLHVGGEALDLHPTFTGILSRALEMQLATTLPHATRERAAAFRN